MKRRRAPSRGRPANAGRRRPRTREALPDRREARARAGGVAVHRPAAEPRLARSARSQAIAQSWSAEAEQRQALIVRRRVRARLRGRARGRTRDSRRGRRGTAAHRAGRPVDGARPPAEAAEQRRAHRRRIGPGRRRLEDRDRVGASGMIQRERRPGRALSSRARPGRSRNASARVRSAPSSSGERSACSTPEAASWARRRDAGDDRGRMCGVDHARSEVGRQAGGSLTPVAADRRLAGASGHSRLSATLGQSAELRTESAGSPAPSLGSSLRR